MPKILIIDDVDYIRKSIDKVLTENGFDCDVCENGKVAMEKVQETAYELIITDIMMPEADGFEFLEFLKNQKPAIATTPVLAISGGSKTINSDMALGMIHDQVSEVLQKPFGKQDLINAVAKVLGNNKIKTQ